MALSVDQSIALHCRVMRRGTALIGASTLWTKATLGQGRLIFSEALVVSSHFVHNSSSDCSLSSSLAGGSPVDTSHVHCATTHGLPVSTVYSTPSRLVLSLSLHTSSSVW